MNSIKTLPKPVSIREVGELVNSRLDLFEAALNKTGCPCRASILLIQEDKYQIHLCVDRQGSGWALFSRKVDKTGEVYTKSIRDASLKEKACALRSVQKMFDELALAKSNLLAEINDAIQVFDQSVIEL